METLNQPATTSYLAMCGRNHYLYQQTVKKPHPHQKPTITK